MRVDPISLDQIAPVETSFTPVSTTSFSDVVASALREASEVSHEAKAKASALSAGTLDDIHGTMIAAKEAEITVHLIGTVRNKLLDAFHELWRIGV